jgi:hypothetical protein
MEKEVAKCGLCGEPMPPGEEMFKYHGYSGNCPKPPLQKPKVPRQNSLVEANKESPHVEGEQYIFLGEIPNVPGRCVIADLTGRICTGRTEHFVEVPENKEETSNG